MPGSCTDTRASAPARSTETVIRPPCGVYLMAFDIRFTSTCSSRSRSPSTTTGTPARRRKTSWLRVCARNGDTSARQPAVARTLQLELVMRSRLLVREDAANPLEHRLPVLRGHLRELLMVDLVESLPIHRAQRESEDLLDPVRGHAQHAGGVEE